MYPHFKRYRPFEITARVEQRLAAHQYHGGEVALYATDGGELLQVALVRLHVKEVLLRQRREVQTSRAAQVAVVAYLHVEHGFCRHVPHALDEALRVGLPYGIRGHCAPYQTLS